uniref:Late embryogenesis abundant protein LEA-2 subgroup domain-containing protein n=1 Tax=Salix viminalis TaxID=40686 RepID=A0A6N2NGT5_SALVM
MAVCCHLMLPPQHCSDHSRHCRRRRPRVPVISVVDAHLFHFSYDGAGVLVTQINIVVRSQNDNMKAHAAFSNFNLELLFDGIRIAVLSTAAPYEVRKNSSVDFNYDYTSDPTPLSPQQMQYVDAFLKEDEVRFDLKGGVRARWRVGGFGSFRFLCNLNCRLRFHAANGTFSTCSSSLDDSDLYISKARQTQAQM